MSSKNHDSPKKKRSPCTRFWSGELDLIKKYFNGATIDGIEHVTEGKSRVRRVVWALILLASLGVCLFFLIGHFTNFSRKPTSTTLNVIRPEKGLAFPAVTFCNLNPVSRSYAETNHLESFIEYYLRSPNRFFESNRSQCEDIIDEFDPDDTRFTIDEVFRSGGQKLDNLVLSCQFVINSTTTIDCSNSLTTVVTEIGLCYSFNYIVNNPVDTFINLNGHNYGLKVTLNITQSDYIVSPDRDAGAIVTVHERDTLPDPVEKGLAILPGTHARIGISIRQFIDSTGKGECRDPDSSHPVFPDLRYSPSGCRIDTLYQMITNDSSCNCVEFRTELLDRIYSSERNCTLTDLCCLERVKDTIGSLTQCPPSCDQTFYDPVISYSQFPFTRLAEDLSAFTGDSVQKIQDDLLTFSVFFTDLYVQNSETIISYGPRELVADIGGTLGLFLGASVITFMEIIILFYDELKAICCSSRKVRKGWDTFEMKALRSRMEEDEKDDADEDTPGPDSHGDEEVLQKKEEKEKDKESVKTSSV